MEIGVVTIFPRMLDAVAKWGVTGQAVGRGVLSLRCWDPRDFAEGRHRAVDGRPYGGGAGMVMMAGPMTGAIDAAVAVTGGPVVYLSPQGERLNQGLMAELAGLPGMVLVAGRYEGVDERVVESRVTREVSVGDYVLAGGEVAAMVVIEGVARLLPGVLGNPLSVGQDSFSGEGLGGPCYTRPEVFEGRSVPAVLVSGDHEAIRQWRRECALARTRERRPDLLVGEGDAGDVG